MNSGCEGSQVQASEPTERDLFWLQIAQNSIEKSMDAANEGARSQIGMVSTLMSGGYAAVISFSGLKNILAIGGYQKPLIILLIVAPMLFWLLSLMFAYDVFNPQMYRVTLISPDIAKEFYTASINYKNRSLYCSRIALAIGLMLLIVNIFTYLSFIPIPS